MWDSIWANLPFTGKTKIFFSNSPSRNGNYLRTRVLGLVRHQLCYKSSLKLHIKPLHKRFPLEQVSWDALTSNAPDHCEELLRGRNSETLVWLKADKSGSRFKIKALSPIPAENRLSPCDILLSELEPIPADNLEYYTPILSLFTLAQINVPSIEQKRDLIAYALKLKQLSPALDKAISSPADNMPQSFHFKLKRFQAWAWSVMGIAFEDTAKLGRAKRAIHTLLADWRGNKQHLEYGQTLCNLAALQLTKAKLLTGIESYEACLDYVGDAQSVLSRANYPFIWAQLQELKGETHINLGERYCDIDHLETSVHTLQTVKRIWSSSGRTDRLANTQFRIGGILHKIGRSGPGTERLEQSATAYYGSVYCYEEVGHRRAEGKARLSLAQTLIDLGERAGSKERLEEALKVIHIAREKLSNWDSRLTLDIIEAHALTRLGCQYTDDEDAQNYLKTAVSLFTKILKRSDKIDIYDRLHSIEFLGMALGQLGKHMNNPDFVLRSSQEYQKAAQIITDGSSVRLPDYVLGRLFGQLARNNNWLGRQTSKVLYLEQAANAYQKAISVTDRDNMSRDWAILQCELAETLIAVSKHKTGESADIVDQAIQAYHRSLTALQRKRAPLLWAQIKNKLAEALTLSGALGGGTPCLEMAIESYEKALEEWQPGSSSIERATALNNMANVLADLGRREADGSKLNEAQRAFSEAYDLYSSLGQTNFAERVHNNLSAIKNLLSNDLQIDAHKFLNNRPEKTLILSHT